MYYKLFLVKAIKFGLTGFVGLAIDFTLTWLLREQAGMQGYVANMAGFIVAASSNFALNKYWTFGDRSRKMLRQYGVFLVVSVVGLMLNTLFLVLFHQHIGFEFYMSKAVAIIIVFFWNFIANALFTFKGKNMEPALQ